MPRRSKEWEGCQPSRSLSPLLENGPRYAWEIMEIKKSQSQEPIPFIRKICAHLSEEGMQEAEDNFRAFLKIAIRISERRVFEKKKEDDSALTESFGENTISGRE